MNYLSLKDLIITILTQSWARYGSSWVLHALTIWLGFDAKTASNLEAQIFFWLLTAAAAGLDWLQYRATHKAVVQGATDKAMEAGQATTSMLMQAGTGLCVNTPATVNPNTPPPPEQVRAPSPQPKGN